MRLIALIFALTVVCVLAGPAGAGDQRGCCLGATLEGYDCETMCPLAQRVNPSRATGTEAIVASRIVRKDVSAAVARNMMKI